MVPFSCELYWNAERAVFILQSLRRKGVRVAIDDFGTGYSSLSYLRKFPLDALKIDQSFVHRIAESPDEMTIVSAIISMGRSLNLRVIAEGVETAQDLAFLQEHEYHEAQGYYFSRPVPADQFTALLTAERGNQPHCPLRLSVFRNASPLLPAGINQSQRFQC
jgi:EAL domain-containing protein (putative c-di-GMP-specific phosphodiesterase class I)